MKPLTHCPHCHSLLRKKQIPENLNSLKYKNCPARCVVDYFQHYKSSYDDPVVEYVTFNTKDKIFLIYMYFDHFLFQNISHIYSNSQIKIKGKAIPIMELPLEQFSLETLGLDGIQQYINALLPFI